MLAPFAHGHPLQLITISAIYVGAMAMLLHAYFSFGFRYAFTYVVLTSAFAIIIEQIGVRTGWPFGDHSFDPSLGVSVFNVPLVIPFLWIMLAHPVLVAARRVTQNWVFLYGGATMMAWHLFIDPALAYSHRVIWKSTGSHIPFEREIPFSNPAGWLFTGMVLIAILHYSLPKERRKQGAEFVAVDIFLAWTLLAGVFDNVFFFDHPGIAVFAGSIYALVLAPYFFYRWLGKPED
jgi:putative membrane protein